MAQMIATEPSHARERRWQPDLKNNVNSRRTVMRVVRPLGFVRNMNSTHSRQNTMKPSIHTVIGLLFLVVLLQGVANLWMTANHNAQIKAQTEVFNGQLKAQTEVHNTQLVAQAESFNAQLLAQAAESQKK
jgi:hypothetical protein